jgi:hypothetical protein
MAEQTWKFEEDESMGAVTESWQDGIIMAKEYDTDAGYAVCIRCV